MRRPLLDDPVTGLAAVIPDCRLHKGEPEVFVASAYTADMRAYGYEHRAVSNGSGAGLTAAEARGAAVGECTERYALGVVHDEDLVCGTHDELVREFPGMVPPRNWALYAPGQEMHGLPLVPFREDVTLGWVRGENLTRRLDALLPASMTHMPYIKRFVDRGESLISAGVSTGAACAKSRGDVLLKGLCECIERDAFAIAWRKRLVVPRIDLDRASGVGELFRQRFACPGLEYVLLDITLDIPIPCVFGLLIDHRSTPPAIMAGGACHCDPEVAVTKTMLELVQALKWIQIMKGPYPERLPGFGNIRNFEDRVRLYAFRDMTDAVQPWIKAAPVRSLSAMKNVDAGSTGANLRRLIAILKERGEEVLAADLTTCDAEECGLFVVKVIVPGLEQIEGDHLLPFWGGRRWREVPSRIGARSLELDANGTNPFPHPYP